MIYTKRYEFNCGLIQINFIPALKTLCGDIVIVFENGNDLICLIRLTPRDGFRLMGQKYNSIDKLMASPMSEI